MYYHEKLTYQPLSLPDRVRRSDAEALGEAQAYRDYLAKRHSVRDFCADPVPEEIIRACVQAAGLAPSGANHQPWFFVAISDPAMKSQIRAAAEEEEKAFYAGGGGDEWIKALEPIGTGASKPHLDIAPWLIVIFAQRYGQTREGHPYKNYYIPESTGIATGFLISALHQAGLTCLTHTPNPMKFLNKLCNRPESEKPLMILAVGHPSQTATVPAVAKLKKPIDDILTVYRNGG